MTFDFRQECEALPLICDQAGHGYLETSEREEAQHARHL